MKRVCSKSKIQAKQISLFFFKIHYMSYVDQLLFRKLKPGKEYDKYFPKFENIKHEFDKPTDNSTTYDTLDYMAKWSKKYSWQMKKLAPVLKGGTLQETCNNIYNFLYWHFQYKLDGEAQQLYSPSAAWYNRNKGFDCKTFSILAQMILANLGIKSSFRMVQQSSPYWSHVYVVVPNGNKYYVIDATTHDNVEVNYTKKHDKNMYHLGLASPVYPTNLGCSCNGSSLQKNGLNNPLTLQDSINNFHSFLDELEKKGVSRKVTDNMLTIIKYNVEKGIDPNLNEVFQKALAMNMKGLGDIVGDLITGASAGQVDGNNAIIQGVIKSIIPTSFISSTFGNVFANGFDLSCWGASLSPSTTKADMEKHHKPYFSGLVNRISAASSFFQKQESINKYIRDVYIMHAHYSVYLINATSWSSCSKKGIQAYIKFMAALKTSADQLVQELVAKGSAVSTQKISPVKLTLTKDLTGVADKVYGKNNAASSFVDVPVILLREAPGQTPGQNPAQNFNVVDNGNGYVTVTNPANGQSVTVTKEEAAAQGFTSGGSNIKSTGISTGTAVMAAGGIAAAFLLFMPKTDVTKK